MLHYEHEPDDQERIELPQDQTHLLQDLLKGSRQKGSFFEFRSQTSMRLPEDNPLDAVLQLQSGTTVARNFVFSMSWYNSAWQTSMKLSLERKLDRIQQLYAQELKLVKICQWSSSFLKARMNMKGSIRSMQTVPHPTFSQLYSVLYFPEIDTCLSGVGRL